MRSAPPLAGGALGVRDKTDRIADAHDSADPSPEQPAAPPIELELGDAKRASTPKHREALHKLGISDSALYGPPYCGRLGGHFGFAPVDFLDGGLFEPAVDFGTPALIVGLHDAVPGGGVVDLLALSRQEGRYGLRLGTVTVAGLVNVEHARTMSEPVLVHGDPLAWLREDCEGCCVLDWRGPLQHLLDGCRIVAADHDTGRRLTDNLERYSCTPPVRVRRGA